MDFFQIQEENSLKNNSYIRLEENDNQMNLEDKLMFPKMEKSKQNRF